MTVAVLLCILASLLWGMTNHIDKFMINEIDDESSSVKVLLIFSTFVTGIILSPLWLILGKFNVSISLISLISVFCGSFAYITATVLYFKAMQENDASIISIMFQMIPVFSYILALILFKENLTIKQIMGSV